MGTNANLTNGSAILALAPDSTGVDASLPIKGKGKKNANLGAARNAKNDEFYTRLEDIDKELSHYTEHFKGQSVFCNCDDPSWSNFWQYFHLNFDALGLRRLVSTYYAKNGSKGGVLVCRTESRDAEGLPVVEERALQGDGDFESGDFRSHECVELLKEADIVCTNPPFSLFREYIAQLLAHNKKFLVIGSMNAITYKEVFPIIRDNLLWLGNSNPHSFCIDRDKKTYKKFGNVCWFTNLKHSKRQERLKLLSFRNGNEDKYPKYDNYDAINVNKALDIPLDYDGVMGVPISFLSKHNPDEFEIVGLAAGNIRGLAGIETKTKKDGPYIDGKLKFGRIFIKRKSA